MKLVLKSTMNRSTFAGLVLLAVTAFSGIPRQLIAQTTAFTYQGRLTDNGAPANGVYDFEFTAYNVATGGAAISATVTNVALGVTNGLFTAVVDFGAQVFNGNVCWLDLAARTNGAVAFTTLNPRQFLTPVPTALFAGTAATALTVSGTVPSASLSGAYGSAVDFNNLGNSFSGSGAGLVNVPGTVTSKLGSGTMVQAIPNTSYVLTNSQTVTVTLPAAPKIGDLVRVAGVGTGGWNLAQNAGQIILGPNLANPLTPWTQIFITKTLQGQAISSSADGTHLIVGFAGFLEISGDSGATWTVPANQPFGNGAHIAVSADGQHAAMAMTSRQIYVSSDFGANWILETNSVSANYHGIAMSADGSHLAAAANGGGIYTSADFGTNWMLTSAPSNVWETITSSGDGSRLVAACLPGGIYLSTDFGANWHLTSAPATNLWTAIASSVDGTRVIATANSTDVWFSTDGGQDWQPSVIAGSIYSIACSADGLHVAAAAASSILLSSDGGLTWSQSHAPGLAWRGIASSAAGNFVATGYNIGIWAYRTSTSTGTNGYLSGGPDSAVEVQYFGNGQFLPVSHEGALITH
jgi:hypothetical protein